MEKPITDKDRERAAICAKKCPICQKARKEQKGFAFWFVKFIEGSFCPNCKAYTKVYSRKAHEPVA